MVGCGLQRAKDDEKGRAATGRKAARLARPDATRRTNMAAVRCVSGEFGQRRGCARYSQRAIAGSRHRESSPSIPCGQKSLCKQVLANHQPHIDTSSSLGPTTPNDFRRKASRKPLNQCTRYRSCTYRTKQPCPVLDTKVGTTLTTDSTLDSSSIHSALIKTFCLT